MAKKYCRNFIFLSQSLQYFVEQYSILIRSMFSWLCRYFCYVQDLAKTKDCSKNVQFGSGISSDDLFQARIKYKTGQFPSTTFADEKDHFTWFQRGRS